MRGLGERRRRARARRGAAGFALLDALLASVVLVVGILAALYSATRNAELRGTTASFILAHNSARDVLEQLRGGDLASQVEAYTVDGQVERSGQVIEVAFPEELLLAALGAPPAPSARYRDLDADGRVEFDPTSPERVGLLPVRITVRDGRLRYRIDSLVTELP